MEANRQAEDKFLKENTTLLQGTGGGNEWERVNKLIDFQTNTSW